MKLVMITTYATPRNMRRELLVGIASRGHAITVVAPEEPALMQAPLAAIGAGYRQWKVNRTGIDPAGDLTSAGRLLAILRAERPDVVLIYQIKAVLLGPAMAKLARTNHVVTLVNGLGAVFDEQGFGATWKAKLARRIYGLSLGQVDTIVFQNPDDPQLLRTLGILPADADVRIVPGSGVDLTKLIPARAPTVPTFTLMSRLVVSKGIREFISAARAIRSRHPGVLFKLVGQLEAANHPDAVQQRELDAWIAEGLVEYVGFTDDVRGVLAATTVFVLPSYYREGVPRTNLEALAMGLPIVTTDWVGCRETVEEGINGFLVAPKDVAALTDRMERYVTDPGLVITHGAASRALAERRFDIAHVNELMMQALQLD